MAFSPQRRAICAFSLIELLVVMAVIAVLTALIAPAVSSLARSSALVSSGNMMTNLATLARQTAMSKNTLTALVLLGAQGTPADYRTLTVLEYNDGGGWSQSTGWQLLPTGIIVDFSDTKDCTFMANSPTPFPFITGPPAQANPPVLYPDPTTNKMSPVKKTAYAARIFLPTGGLRNPDDAAQLRLIEGFAQGASIVRTRPADPTKAANYYDIAIVGTTGAIKVSRP